MGWTVEKQKKFMKLVPESHRYSRTAANKLFHDADLTGRVPENTWFLSDSALAEAYRAGAHDAIFKDED